jgi:uncharacterized membrane protein
MATMRGRYGLLLAGLLLLALILLWYAPVRRMSEAARLAADVAAGEAPSALKRATPDPTRTTIAYSIDGRASIGDLYRPGGRPRAMAIAVPGVVEDGKDDARFVAFATSLARAGFLVLAPDIPNVRALKIGSDDADVIADAVRFLASAGEEESRRTVGLFAFSYAAGPAILAAMKPEARDLVRFICAIGGYYSVDAAVTYFTTGYYRRNGRWVQGAPSAYARWVFLMSNTARVADARDRELLRKMAERRLADDGADISDLAAALGPEGRAIYALLSNTDPDQVAALVVQLSPAIREEMQALDLKNKDFGLLRAHLVLVHGRTDTLVPYTESVALARAARSPADLFLIGDLGHVEPRLQDFGDAFQFWRATYAILGHRDAMPTPRQSFPAAR